MRILPALFATLLLVTSSVGCRAIGENKPAQIAKKIDIPSGVPWKREKPPEPGVPTRVVATWTDAVLHRGGQSATRGFGGKLFFYDGADSEPILVEGQLVVYAFDEAGRDSTDNRPTKRYIFPPAQFAKHQSESELGVSYSVWLPWDSVDGPSTDVSLIARFEPLEGGRLVVSEQAKNRLPGRYEANGPAVETRIAQQSLTPSIRQASHSAEITAPGAGEPRRRLETTSIKLPPRSRPRLNPPAAAGPTP